MNRDMRLYFLAIGLPALFIAAVGIALLCREWERATDMRNRALAAQAKAVAIMLQARMRETAAGGEEARTGALREMVAENNGGATAALLWRKGAGIVWSAGDVAPELAARLAPNAKWTPEGSKTFFAKHGWSMIRTDGASFAVAWARPGPQETACLVLNVGELLSGGDPRTLVLAGACLLLMLLAILVAGAAQLLRAARAARAEACAKADFVSLVGHELRTPFASMLPNIEMLLDGTISDAGERRAALEAVQEECMRMRRLTERLLAFSRVEARRRMYAMAEFDLVPLVRDTVEAFRGRFADHGIDETLPPECTVYADRDAVREIIENLLDNAAKYASSAGLVEVSVACEASGAVLVRVADRGPGVAPGDARRVFERFWRADDALTRTTDGLGIGLPFSRELARGCGGDLGFEVRPGGGAVFTLVLNRRTEDGRHSGSRG